MAALPCFAARASVAVQTFVLHLASSDYELQSWLTDDFDLVGHCLSNLAASTTPAALSSIEYLVCEIIFSARRDTDDDFMSEEQAHVTSPLLSRILRHDSVTQLMETAFADDVTEARKQTCLTILLAVLSHPPRNDDEPEPTQQDNERLKQGPVHTRTHAHTDAQMHTHTHTHILRTHTHLARPM